MNKPIKKQHLEIPIIIMAILLCLGLGIFLLVRSGVFSKDPVVEVKPNNTYTETLHVITDEDYRPYSFYADDNSFSGHDVELITMIANKLEMNLDLKFMDWYEGIDAITNGEADILMTCDYSDTFPGVDALIKSEPISVDDFIVYSKKEIKSSDELYGKKIAIMRNGNVGAQVDMMDLKKYCVEYENNRDAMQALIDGEVDYAIMRQTVGSALIQELNTKKIKGYISIGMSYMCFGIKTGDTALATKIDNALEEMKMNGELTTLKDKWLTTFIRPYTFAELLTNNLWIVITFAALILVIIIILVISRIRRTYNEKEEYRNTQLIDLLSQDFSCVNYIELTDDPTRDPVINYRVSEELKELIPGWEQEKTFYNKLQLLRDYLVYEPDKQLFREETNREKTIEALSQDHVYFVTFRALVKEEIRYYQMKFSAVRKGEKLIGIIAGLHSVDDQTKKELALQEQLEDALTQAESASRAKTTFLNNMSHDIRTPMNAILGFTDVALRHEDDLTRVDDSLKKIKSSGGHLLNLINDVLEMSRIESGRLSIAENPTNINEVINCVDQISRTIALQKDIDFDTVIGQIKNQYVLADELHLNEILINLVSNAVKYTPAGGKVNLYAEEIENDIEGQTTFRFAVKDNGIGMSLEFQEHLFDSFAREETATVSKIEGTGLGLSIVKKIIDLAGGIIKVESHQGEGSSFTIELPLKIMSDSDITIFKEKEDRAANTEQIVDFVDKKVLLVEDNALNREIAIDILSEIGFVIDTAEDGEIAVNKIKTNGVDYYDFVLMDIQMPVMNGYEATKCIRELEKGNDVPIIALSANAFKEDVDKSLAAGMNAHIAKPIDVNALLDAMGSLLKK